MRFWMRNLWRSLWNWRWSRTFVKISASRVWEGTYVRVIRLPRNLFWEKWQLTSISLVHSWNTRLAVICIATWLSQCDWTGQVWENLRSRSNSLSHFNLQHMIAIERYIASIKERETISCFLIIHEMGEVPKKILVPCERALNQKATCSVSITISSKD